MNFSMGAKAPKQPDGFRSNFAVAQGNTNLYRKGSFTKKLAHDDSNISVQEAIQIFPSLQKLAPATGRHFGQDKNQLQKAISGFPAFERRLKELLVKAWEEEERSQREASLPNIRPEEVLRCRYLRLSQNNINTLLQLCKDSGMDVDIHPHMKESDIDINTVMSSTNNTVSL